MGNAAKYRLQGQRAVEKSLLQEEDSPVWVYPEKRKDIFMSLFQTACGCSSETPERPSLLFCIYLTFPREHNLLLPQDPTGLPKIIEALNKN